jgi:hypothetical protein
MLNRHAIGFIVTSVVAVALLMPLATAQIRGAGVAPASVGIRSMSAGSGIGTAGITRSGAGFAGGPARSHHGHSFGRSAIFLPYPYYDSDYGFDSEVAPQPQVVVVPAAAPVQPVPPSLPLEPLLIEWKGDHFERMTLSQRNAGKEQSGPDYSAKSAVRSSAPGSPSARSLRAARKGTSLRLRESAPEAVRELPPAVLVFRDGRTEEVSSYTIMSGTIYSKADYWTTGAWTRKIQIADLDVPATLKLNHDHGLKFVLPTSPNEIVTRP